MATIKDKIKGKVRLCHILPRQSLFDSEQTIPLDDEKFFKATASSLKEWVKTRKPNVLREHERDGESLGEVVGIIEDEKGIFAEMLLNPDVDQKLKEGKLRFVSPTVAWNFRADDFGTHGSWPAALLEVSMVSTPRHSRQLPMTQINEFAEVDTNSGFVSQLSAVITDTESYLIEDNEIMDMENIKAMLVELLAEHLEPVIKRLDALEPKAEEEVEEEVKVEEEVEVEALAEEAVVEEEAEVKEEDSELAEDEKPEDEKEEEEESASELSEGDKLERRALMAEAKVAELQAALAHRDAESAVALDIKDRPHLSTMSEKLVKIWMSDRDMYKDVLGIVPVDSASVLSERVTVGYASTKTTVDNPFAAANQMSKDKGISYKDALATLGVHANKN